MQKCLDAVTRTEETLVQFKRKGAAGDVRKKLLVDSNISSPSAFGGNPLFTEVNEVEAWKDELESLKSKLFPRLDSLEYKIK